MQTLTHRDQALPETDPYLQSFQWFERQSPRHHPSWLFPLRKAALSRFAELGFPTLRDEDWRFTNVAPIARLPFDPVFDYSRDGLTSKTLQQFHFARLKASTLVFVNGHHSAELSSVLPQDEGIRLE